VATVIQLIISGIAIGPYTAWLPWLRHHLPHVRCGELCPRRIRDAGGMLSYWLWKHVHVPYALAAVLTVIAVCVFGLGIYQLVVAPLRRAPAVMIVLGTLAVSLLSRLFRFSGSRLANLRPSFSATQILDVFAGLYTQNLWVILMVAIVVTALALLNNKTHLGRR